mgnify:CR=1 FL=1
MNTFEFYAPAYLAKSGNKNKPYVVGGLISDDKKDLDGECMKSLDWSIFTSGFGKIKYEHKDIPEPHCFIGFPTQLKKSGDKTFFEGELVGFDPDLPDEKLSQQQRNAKSTVSLLQHMEEFNRTHPNGPLQKAGWSIEGEYLSKSKNGDVAARVVNVVFTTKPRNMRTFAELKKSTEFKKALELNNTIGSTDQTGFDATRKENLVTKNKKGKKMKTKFDVYRTAISKGSTPEDAKKEADKWEEDRVEDLEKSSAVAEKSLDSTKNALNKSIETAQKVQEVEIDLDVKGHKKGLAKSIPTGKEDADATEYLTEQSEVLMAVLEGMDAINKKINMLAKSIEIMASSQVAGVDSQSHLLKSVDTANSHIEAVKVGIFTLGEKLRSKPANNGLITDTAKIQFQDNNAENQDQKPLNKSQVTYILEQLLEEKKIDENTLINYVGGGQHAQVPEEVTELVKSKAMDLFKAGTNKLFK